MERMKKKKKEIRLRTFFVRFLLKLVAAVLLAFLLWLLQITVSVGTGLILPANAAEKEALAYLHTIGAHTDIVSSGIPSACGYAIYDASGELLETDMSGSIRENADLLALSGQDSLSANMLGRTYVKRQTDSRRRNPQSESRLYHPADCHLRIQPGSCFSGRAEIRTFRLLKRAVAHAATAQTSIFRARP